MKNGKRPMTVRSRFIITSMGFCAAHFYLALHAPPLFALDYPGKRPGAATARIEEDFIELKNDVLAVTWRVGEGRLRLEEVVHLTSPTAPRARGGEIFVLTRSDGSVIRGSDLRLIGEPKLEKLEANPKARRGAERFGGWRAAAHLASKDGSLDAQWEADLRDESNYVIQRITLRPIKNDLSIDEIRLIDVKATRAKVAGVTQGSPVVSGEMFFAYEHPMAQSQVTGDRVTCALRRGKPLKAGRSLQQTCVIGVTPIGQLRRGFLYYVERERAHPYRPFLHYNSWYDIAWGDRKFNEAQSLEAIEIFGRELIEKRGVKIDSFVFDDGWDDNKTLWRFHKGFPHGFKPLRTVAEKYGSSVGTWLSPFGGYGEAKAQRLEYGKQQGFEINRNGFSLAGPRYYERFYDICAEMVRDYGVNFFKYDGMAAGNNVAGGAEFLDDIEALMRLIGELRKLDPELYINATTGTWCSPYFLWHADSTWRNGDDMGFAGAGSKRQQWITYRDLHTYRNVVQRGPLYPLNSIMTQGIVHARHGHASELGSDLKDMADEIRSFFGSGTALQELYISPKMMTGEMWDLLAEAARWSRERADTLIDTHWIGGDPGRGEVYGYASWSPRQGILALRNPGENPAEISIDIGNAFELPEGAAGGYRLIDPWDKTKASPDLVVTQGATRTFALGAFDVRVFDALPIP